MLRKTITTPPRAAVAVRSLAEADSGYASAAETLARLKTKSRDLDREESALLDGLRNRPQQAEISGRVLALLGDAPEPDVEQDGTSARLKAIAGERIDLRRAIDIAVQRVATARFAASKVIADELRPEYRKRVQALAAALQAAQAAHDAYLELVNDLNAGDVAWTAHLAPLQAHRIFGNDNDRVAAWMREAAPMLEDRT